MKTIRTTMSRVEISSMASNAGAVAGWRLVRKASTIRSCFVANRRGGAVLEAMLVLSLLLSLSLGAAEYGYALFFKHSLQAATTVGLRTAILAGSTNATVTAAVASQMQLNGMQNVSYTLTTVPASLASCASGTYVTVTVSSTWGATGINILPASMGGFPTTKVFSAAATMVHE
jgi:Flp pilus assembly protein TadG